MQINLCITKDVAWRAATLDYSQVFIVLAGDGGLPVQQAPRAACLELYNCLLLRNPCLAYSSINNPEVHI